MPEVLAIYTVENYKNRDIEHKPSKKEIRFPFIMKILPSWLDRYQSNTHESESRMIGAILRDEFDLEARFKNLIKMNTTETIDSVNQELSVLDRR